MDNVKYIADGFLNDAERLLGDFIQKNSMEFSVFAEIWKNHNFALIYLGRQSEKELNEFTREIFYLSTNFLSNSSLLHQVGGIFILYALYRNQILSPPVKIRIVSHQFKSILNLRDTCISDESRSLHYVINYLIENAFDFVAHPRLLGPISLKYSEIPNNIFSDHNSNLQITMKSALTEFFDGNILQEIHQLHSQYVEACKLLNIPTLTAVKSGTLKKLASRLDELKKWARKTNEDSVLISPPIECKELEPLSSQKTVPQSSIGSRRAQLKALAFGGTLPSCESSAANTSGIREEDEPVCNEVSIPNASALKKRTRKRKHISRSKKCDSEKVERSEFESNLNNFQEDAPVGVKRRRRQREIFTRNRRYYMEETEGSSIQNMPSTSMNFNFLRKNQLNIASDSDDSELSDEIDDAPPSAKDVESLQSSSVQKV